MIVSDVDAELTSYYHLADGVTMMLLPVAETGRYSWYCDSEQMWWTVWKHLYRCIYYTCYRQLNSWNWRHGKELPLCVLLKLCYNSRKNYWNLLPWTSAAWSHCCVYEIKFYKKQSSNVLKGRLFHFSRAYQSSFNVEYCMYCSILAYMYMTT